MQVFGPVMTVHSFRDEDEAISLTNDSRYGLASAVFSSDPKKIERFQREVRVGACWVNCNQPLDVQVPWGGVKR